MAKENPKEKSKKRSRRLLTVEIIAIVLFVMGCIGSPAIYYSLKSSDAVLLVYGFSAVFSLSGFLFIFATNRIKFYAKSTLIVAVLIIIFSVTNVVIFFLFKTDICVNCSRFYTYYIITSVNMAAAVALMIPEAIFLIKYINNIKKMNWKDD